MIPETRRNLSQSKPVQSNLHCKIHLSEPYYSVHLVCNFRQPVWYQTWCRFAG